MRNNVVEGKDSFGYNAQSAEFAGCAKRGRTESRVNVPVFTPNPRTGGKVAQRWLGRHDAAAQAKYQETKQFARSQSRILAGTPGSLKQRTQSGNRYWVRAFTTVDGRMTDEYIGPVASVEASRIERIRNEIELAKAPALLRC